MRTDSASTLSTLASDINALNGVAGASAIDTGQGSSPARLVLTARNTGLAGALTLDAAGFSGLPSSFTSLRARAGRRRSCSATRPARTPWWSTAAATPSPTWCPGVTLSLAKADPDTDVTVSVDRDTDGMTTRYQALVDAANALLTSIDKHTRYDVATKTGGALVGNAGARDLAAQVYSLFYSASGSGTVTSLGAVGISTTRSGQYAFDAAAMTAGATSDPAGVAAFMSSLASRLSGFGTTAVGDTGTIGIAQTAMTDALADLQTREDAYQVHLTLAENRYRTQFSKLDASMGVLRSQSDWLAGQLKGLASWS